MYIPNMKMFVLLLCFKLNLALPSINTGKAQWEIDNISKSESSLNNVKEAVYETAQKTSDETAKLEQPGIPDKIVDAYDNIKAPPEDVLPILDTIVEQDKYGNDGDLLGGLSRTIINGYEAFSNILNLFIQKPKEIARSFSKGITAQLDAIGGKLVGL